MELLLSEEDGLRGVDPHDRQARPCRTQDLTPVFMGTAYRNKGVQPLLDAIVRYLPSPLDRTVTAKKYDKPDEKFPLEPDPAKPFVGMAFKIVEDPFGQLTFMRIYQGTINKGDTHYNQRTGQKQRFSRIVQDARRQARGNRHAPAPATSWPSWASTAPAAIRTPRSTSTARWKACSCPSRSSRWPSTRCRAKAPTSWARPCSASARKIRRSASRTDEETAETRDRRHGRVAPGDLRRADSPRVQASRSKSAPRRSATAKRPTKTAEYNFKHKKQTGGSGQYAHIVGKLESLPDDCRRDLRVRGRRSSAAAFRKEYIPVVEKGFRDSLHKGPVAELPDRGRQGHPRRRLVPRRRQLGHGVPDLRPQLLPRDVPEDQAGAARADDEGRSRSADRSTRARSPAS